MDFDHDMSQPSGCLTSQAFHYSCTTPLFSPSKVPQQHRDLKLCLWKNKVLNQGKYDN